MKIKYLFITLITFALHNALSAIEVSITNRWWSTSIDVQFLNQNTKIATMTIPQTIRGRGKTETQTATIKNLTCYDTIVLTRKEKTWRKDLGFSHTFSIPKNLQCIDQQYKITYEVDLQANNGKGEVIKKK